MRKSHTVFNGATPLKTNMDTQTDGLEEVTPFNYGNSLVSMLDFWGVGFAKSCTSLNKVIKGHGDTHPQKSNCQIVRYGNT